MPTKKNDDGWKKSIDGFGRSQREMSRMGREAIALKKKLAVAVAVEAATNAFNVKVIAANQAIALDASRTASGIIHYRDQLREAEQDLEDARHELEKANALAAGFRARAEKAETLNGELTNPVTLERWTKIEALLARMPTKDLIEESVDSNGYLADVNDWLTDLRKART